MKNSNKMWKIVILLSGAAFLVIFLLEIMCFRDIIIVDPQAHNISYNNWGWFVKEWDPPLYWDTYSELITVVIHTVNSIFQLLFGVFTVYIFIASDRFSLRKTWVVLSVVAIIVIDIGIRLFIKYHVDFYRLYMYSIYNAMMGLYMIFCAKRYKP